MLNVGDFVEIDGDIGVVIMLGSELANKFGPDSNDHTAVWFGDDITPGVYTIPTEYLTKWSAPISFIH